MGSAVIIAAVFVVDPRKVTRDDGTHISTFRKAFKLSEELKFLVKMFVDPKIMALFLGMLSCEMPLAMVSSVNGKCKRPHCAA